MKENKDLGYSETENKLRKDLVDINKRETLLLAKPRNKRDMLQLEEVWSEKNKILKELHQFMSAEEKLQKDLTALEQDEKFLAKHSKLIDEESKFFNK